MQSHELVTAFRRKVAAIVASAVPPSKGSRSNATFQESRYEDLFKPRDLKVFFENLDREADDGVGHTAAGGGLVRVSGSTARTARTRQPHSRDLFKARDLRSFFESTRD